MPCTAHGFTHSGRAHVAPGMTPDARWAVKLICALLLGGMAVGSGRLQAADSLSYTVSWLGIPVVEVTVAKVENAAGFQQEYRARTRRWFDPIYAVDNRYRIWLDANSGYPQRYEKEVRERRHSNHSWVQYELAARRISYASGEQRPWPEPTHNLFSALVWIERHPWKVAETRRLLVEVEGVIWALAAHCTEQLSAARKGGPLFIVEARFEGQVAGSPVLVESDIVARLLPGEGHEIRLGIDPVARRYNWIEFGSPPFLVRAKLNLAPLRP